MARTQLGKWAVRSFVASVLLLATTLVVFNTDVLASLEDTVGRDILGLTLWVLTALASLSTLITGAWSWLKLGDHSPVVIVATIYGVLASIFVGMGALPG